LRAVLKKPRAVCIWGVIAMNEFNQLVVLQQGPFGACQATLKTAAGLRRVISQVPMTALVQTQPAITVGYVGPFGHGLFDQVIH